MHPTIHLLGQEKQGKPSSSSSNRHILAHKVMERMQSVFNYCPRDGRPFRENELICPLCDFQRNIDQTPKSHAGMMPQTPQLPWRKLLYVKQDYPDDHVDDTFLEELQKNANVRHYEYWSVVLESTIISQHISSIVIFVAVFIYLYFGLLSSHALIYIGTAGTAIGYGFWDWSNTMLTPDSNYKRRKIFKGAVLFFLTLLGLTPILKTLTEKTSEDTIWALTVILFLANLAFHDYGSGNRRNIKYPGSLSTNAAIFASVVLASRFKTNLHVFGLMSFAVEWFALFPMLRRQVRSISNRGNLALTIVLFLTATTLFSQISPAIVVIYILGMAFLTFVCPFWLIWIQRYKNEIHGPWDEARPKIQHGRSVDYN